MVNESLLYNSYVLCTSFNCVIFHNRSVFKNIEKQKRFEKQIEQSYVLRPKTAIMAEGWPYEWWGLKSELKSL